MRPAAAAFSPHIGCMSQLERAISLRRSVSHASASISMVFQDLRRGRLRRLRCWRRCSPAAQGSAGRRRHGPLDRSHRPGRGRNRALRRPRLRARRLAQEPQPQIQERQADLRHPDAGRPAARSPTTPGKSGWIYNPEDEERFSAALKLKSANTLQVTGYLGIKLLGETYTWKRATAPLDRCAAPANRPT